MVNKQELYHSDPYLMLMLDEAQQQQNTLLIETFLEEKGTLKCKKRNISPSWVLGSAMKPKIVLPKEHLPATGASVLLHDQQFKIRKYFFCGAEPASNFLGGSSPLQCSEWSEMMLNYRLLPCHKDQLWELNLIYILG